MTTKDKYSTATIRRKPSGNAAAQALRDALPSAVAERGGAKGRGEGRAVQVVMPPETLRALKAHAADAETTVRTVVLQALAKAGFPVPADEIKDRRRG